MVKGDIVMVPVDSEQHVRCLREYRKVLQSTMGPSGSCKAIVTSGGYTDIACTCKTLTSRLELSSPICKYINNIAAGHIDHGLYCAVLLCHLLEHQLLSEDSTKRKTEQEAMEVIFQQIKKLLISEYVCKSLCFDSVTNLIPVVRTVIVSKCGTFLSGMEVDGLCMEVIRVFINCVDEETNVVNKIHLKVESGLNAFMSCKGLLYTVTESHHIEIASKILISQAFAALRSVAAQPLLILGGGCLEIWLIGQIHHIKEVWKDVEMSRVATWLQRSLQSTCYAVEMDTLYHHGWRETEVCCGCRLLNRQTVEQQGGAWLSLQEVVSSEVNLSNPRQPEWTLRSDTIVEPQQQKHQVICDVFEAFANLSNIGLIVQEL
ncbi:uncharacterized protein LOC128984266 isoform X2 [Macrosteles quadrilineatus]|uniref:uncharacterized protein LOC128984266 isoform X2 n=1 Tax=Macrosteles quadrilineatus TaxID=74068 RepID=UPI0023E17DB4|nr:uncharacterized protein LOC128984266 isoform X2 [Macrosteles quadrilineatus]